MLGVGFKYFLFSPLLTWGRFPVWLIFFRWVETTNYTVMGERVITFASWKFFNLWMTYEAQTTWRFSRYEQLAEYQALVSRGGEPNKLEQQQSDVINCGNIIKYIYIYEICILCIVPCDLQNGFRIHNMKYLFFINRWVHLYSFVYLEAKWPLFWLP